MHFNFIVHHCGVQITKLTNYINSTVGLSVVVIQGDSAPSCGMPTLQHNIKVNAIVTSIKTDIQFLLYSLSLKYEFGGTSGKRYSGVN